MKKELFQVIMLSVVLLIYFIYHGMTSDFPVSYTIILITAYLSVIAYRIIKILRLRKNKEQTQL
ncbi:MULTISPECIES: hypothetical protein [Bacillus]|jgi:hypothetical protein|uniref:hypothetical protein n=1 Tax=Bacillus TaxID=1386 RepID=UPI00081F9521|nr:MULTISPECIES: hypothetical protein [Bacillus]AOC55684.1 hypothetical protein BEN31_02230 [Bacillus pumilus]MBR0587409.1 hypothetical protein [Bacillus pumilus DW2J2]MBR0618858.1 hypothetical protein [Bacillus pumilus]MBR0625154.1 hypothetical protein [Bacillus pumilus]MCY7725319.1 hypothetical protein [Bacillus pumilus]